MSKTYTLKQITNNKPNFATDEQAWLHTLETHNFKNPNRITSSEFKGLNVHYQNVVKLFKRNAETISERIEKPKPILITKNTQRRSVMENQELIKIQNTFVNASVGNAKKKFQTYQSNIARNIRLLEEKINEQNELIKTFNRKHATKKVKACKDEIKRLKQLIIGNRDRLEVVKRAYKAKLKTELANVA